MSVEGLLEHIMEHHNNPSRPGQRHTKNSIRGWNQTQTGLLSQSHQEWHERAYNDNLAAYDKHTHEGMK